MAEKSDPNYHVIAKNRRARFDYEIIETLEVGIVLMGSEVKSLRQGKASIHECFAGEAEGELYLFNANITEYAPAKHFNHEPRRSRKLLLHRRQKNKFLGAIRRKGMTLVPMSLYFNHKGRIKLLIGLGKGKKTVDKRETIKQRDWDRSKNRILRSNSKDT
ncbi:MAG: SsrA-binding protein SmpB [Alphaproteobacteria bacterium]